MTEPHRPLVAVLDYGIGNLRSAQKALEHLGADARLTADPGLIADAVGVVLPGVGAFGACMAALERSGLADQSLEAVASGRPFLGICVGMQLLYAASEEDPGVDGLGVLPGTVRRLPEGVKHPQMQWNVLRRRGRPAMLAGVVDPAWVYFVHSFAPEDGPGVAVTCDYGGEVVAGVEADNVWAMQFHPEKSGAAGQQILGNFLGPAPGVNLYPAIDLLDGRCVRLRQGDYERRTDYDDDPVGRARQFAADGAPWIHVVDLDAARTGEPVNREVIGRIVAGVDVPVQVGGGVRSRADAEALWGAGVARVVMGTAALENPDLVAELVPDGAVAIGLDARGRALAAHGWEADAGLDLLEAATRFGVMGVAALVVTEIGRDGMLEGPDLEGLAAVLEVTTAPVVASGGVGSLADVEALSALDLDGVIVGRAIYDERFTVGEAVAVLGP